MAVTDTDQPPTRWPMREELLRAGFEPCARCSRILVDPVNAPYGTCRQCRAKRYRERKERIARARAQRAGRKVTTSNRARETRSETARGGRG